MSAGLVQESQESGTVAHVVPDAPLDELEPPLDADAPLELAPLVPLLEELAPHGSVIPPQAARTTAPDSITTLVALETIVDLRMRA